MTKYQKVSLVLPEQTQAALRDADSRPDRDTLKAFVVSLRNEGWTLESIAKPLGVSREWVRQLEADYGNVDDALRVARSLGFTAPERPIIPEPIKVERPKTSPAVLERLLELQPQAQSVRANSPRNRVEAEEYTRLIQKEHAERGVSLYQLAKDLGVTHGALRFRLVRYGYRKTASESKVYQPILDKNRVV